MDELRTGLELATHDELTALTDILFRPGLNPIDHARGLNPLEVQSQGRHQWLDDVEQRFRFLAADGLTVLRRETHLVSYRSALMRVCQYLRLSYTQTMSTIDLEAEIFLHVLEKLWDRLPAHQRVVMTKNVQHSLQRFVPIHTIPDPIQRDPVRLMLKGGGAVMVSSVLRPWLLQTIARQFALHAATYHAAKQAVVRGGTAIATQINSTVAARVAQRGMALSAARYGAARSILAVIGPALWVWFFADLGWRAIATNYSRTIPAIFTLAQIRLLRGEVILEPA